MKALLIILCALLACISTCKSAVYYVATNGVDTIARGLAEMPFRTIQYGISNANPGDVIMVASGVYTEKVSTIRNGSNSAPIRLLGEPGAEVNQFSIRHSWITVEGFNLNGVDVNQFSASITVSRGTSNIIIANNNISALSLNVGGIRCDAPTATATINNLSVVGNSISNCLNHGLVLRGRGGMVSSNIFGYMNGMDAIQVFGAQHRITRNQFYNISHSPTNANHPDLVQTFGSGFPGSCDIMVDNNYALDCGGQGIRVTNDGDPNIRNWTIINNVFINQGAATVMLAASNCMVIHNTFINCTRNTAHPVTWFENQVPAANGLCYFNAFIGCGANSNSVGMGFFAASGGATNTFMHDYNFVAGPAPTYARKKTTNDAPQWLFTDVNGVNGGDPKFESLANYDFTPKIGSPLARPRTPEIMAIIGSLPTEAAMVMQHDAAQRPRLSSQLYYIGAYSRPLLTLK